MEDSEFDLNHYQENNLEMIENNITFENQQLRGRIINKDTTYNVYNSVKFINNFRLHNANKLTKKIGTLMHLEECIISSAQRLYKLIQSRNWVQGRSTSTVVLTTLYIVCRQRETGHLMIDFSDVMNIDIFKLSKMYLKLSRFMHFDIKLNDPSLYVPRFYKVLNLPPNMKREITDFVLKLLMRMRQDWLGQGRRPTGLIAAAFYIAAKCFEIEKTIREISVSLKVSEETIRKRVNEFKGLEVAKLTKNEFERLEDLDIKIQPEDPPSFKRNRLLSIKQAQENPELQLDNDEDDVPEFMEDLIKEDSMEMQEIPPLQNALEMLEDDKNNIVQPVNEEEILSDEFSDTEINALLLGEHEIRAKTLVWNHTNKDWLEEQALKKKIKETTQTDQKEKRKLERQRLDKLNREKRVDGMENPNDVVKSILQKGKLSTMVNTSALEKLFEEANNYKLK